MHRDEEADAVWRQTPAARPTNAADGSAPAEQPWTMWWVGRKGTDDIELVMCEPPTTLVNSSEAGVQIYIYMEEYDAVTVGIAGHHLLELLEIDGKVRSSQYFDGTEAMRESMRLTLGLSKRVIPEMLIAEALGQLKRAGIVQLTALEGEHAKGTRSQLIEFTPVGREFIKGGGGFPFRDLGGLPDE